MIERAKLAKILENHKHWLAEGCAGWEDMRANLREADLREAELRGANLREADLREANLWGANLRGADLREANLWGADLRGANLRGADLRGADLREAKDIPYIPCACPEAGPFTGFKKCCGNLIVELEIPADAKRLSATGRKCRCDKAKVLRIWNLDYTESSQSKAVSKYDENFVYEVGKTVCVDNFEEDRWIECAPGIHFFINFQEAVDY